jgi:glycosyltransferase involved in cell wall biosynthesis
MTEELVQKVSVLMAVYYKETPSHLDQCLESLAGQTFPADEIIIVKDGMLPIELEEILVSWQKKLPLKIVGYKANKGLAYALNYGLNYCTSELIARMDSDDICLPDRFEKQIDYFKQHKEVVVVGSSLLEFYEDKT